MIFYLFLLFYWFIFFLSLSLYYTLYLFFLLYVPFFYHFINLFNTFIQFAYDSFMIMILKQDRCTFFIHQYKCGIFSVMVIRRLCIWKQPTNGVIVFFNTIVSIINNDKSNIIHVMLSSSTSAATTDTQMTGCLLALIHVLVLIL